MCVKESSVYSAPARSTLPRQSANFLIAAWALFSLLKRMQLTAFPLSPLLGPFPSPYSNRNALHHRNEQQSPSCTKRQEDADIPGKGSCGIQCSLVKLGTGSSEGPVIFGCCNKNDCAEVGDTATGRKSKSFAATPAEKPAIVLERQKLSAPSGDFWESGFSLTNIGSCGLSATEAFERAPAAAARSASADPPSITGSMIQDSACSKECSLAIQISCCPRRSVGGSSPGRCGLSGESLADSGTVLGGSHLQEHLEKTEQEVQSAGPKPGLHNPQSRCICITRQCPTICFAQRAKVRCSSSPGLLITGSPALAQLAYCSQDEANAFPCRSSGIPNQTSLTGTKERNAQANASQSASTANEQDQNNCTSFLGESMKPVQAEGGNGETGGCLRAVMCTRSHEEVGLPSKPAIIQNHLPSRKQEGLEEGHQTNKSGLMFKIGSNDGKSYMFCNESLPQPQQVPRRSTSKEEGCSYECTDAAAFSKGTFSHENGASGASRLPKLREQQDWPCGQHYYDGLLQPRRRATANTTATRAAVKGFPRACGGSPRTTLQLPLESTLGHRPFCASSPGCPFSSFTSSKPLHLLREGMRSSITSTVVLEDQSSSLSNPVQMEEHATTVDGAAVHLASGHCATMKASDLDRSCSVIPSGSGFLPPSVISVSPAHSPPMCPSSHKCIQTTMQCVIPGSTRFPASSPQKCRCLYPTIATYSSLRKSSSRACMASKTAFNGQTLGESAVMEDVKIACPSSPPSTVVPCHVTHRRTTENQTFPLVVRPNDDATATTKNERSHRAETGESSMEDWREASANDAKEPSQPQAAMPSDSRIPSCSSAAKSPQLGAHTNAKESKSPQNCEVDKGLLNPRKIASESPKGSRPRPVQGVSSSALPYAPCEDPYSSSPQCTSAGRSLASRFLSHIRDGIRLTRLRHRSRSASRIPCTTSVCNNSTDSRGADFEGAKGLPRSPESCLCFPEQTAGPKKTSAVHESSPDYSSFSFGSSRIGSGGMNDPTTKISPLCRNPAKVELSTEGREQIPAGVTRHTSQTTTSQVSQARDTAKDTLQLGVRVFAESAFHSCFPPTDVSSNPHSEDFMALANYSRDDSSGTLFSRNWTASPKAVSPTCFSRHEEEIDDAGRATASSSCPVDSSSNWRESTSAAIMDCCPSTEISTPHCDVHVSSGFNTPRATDASLDVTSESSKSLGSFRVHRSGCHLEMAELQKWQHLLELNSILQRWRR